MTANSPVRVGVTMIVRLDPRNGVHLLAELRNPEGVEDVDGLHRELRLPADREHELAGLDAPVVRVLELPCELLADRRSPAARCRSPFRFRRARTRSRSRARSRGSPAPPSKRSRGRCGRGSAALRRRRRAARATSTPRRRPRPRRARRSRSTSPSRTSRCPESGRTPRWPRSEATGRGRPRASRQRRTRGRSRRAGRSPCAPAPSLLNALAVVGWNRHALVVRARAPVDSASAARYRGALAVLAVAKLILAVARRRSPSRAFGAVDERTVAAQPQSSASNRAACRKAGRARVRR